MRTTIIATIAAGLMSTGALAADPSGNWRTEGGKGVVRIASCGGDALCGTLASLNPPNDPATGRPMTDRNNADASKRNRPLVGIPIVISMKPSGTDKWSGQLYNAEDGKTYTGHITYSGGSSLKLEGCALGGLVCKSQTWTKAN